MNYVGSECEKCVKYVSLHICIANLCTDILSAEAGRRDEPFIVRSYKAFDGTGKNREHGND